MTLGNHPVHLSEVAGYSKEELSTMLVECSRSNARMKDEIASLNQNLHNAVIYQQEREANYGLIVRNFEYTLQFRDQWIRELMDERWKQQCRLDEFQRDTDQLDRYRKAVNRFKRELDLGYPSYVSAFSSDDESQDDEYFNSYKRTKLMEEDHQSSDDEGIHSTVEKVSESKEDVVHHERDKENEIEHEVEEVEEEDEEDEERENDDKGEEEEEEEEIQINGYGTCHKEVVVPMLRDISHIKDLVKSGSHFPNLKDCLFNCFTYYGLYLKFPFFCDQKSRTANEKNQTISNTRYYSCCCCRSRLFFVTIPKKEAGCTLTLLSERKHECDMEDLYTNYRDYYTNKKKLAPKTIENKVELLVDMGDAICDEITYIWAFSILEKFIPPELDFQLEQIINIVQFHKELFISNHMSNDEQIEAIEDVSLDVFLSINSLDDHELFRCTNRVFCRSNSCEQTKENYKQQAQKIFKKLLH